MSKPGFGIKPLTTTRIPSSMMVLAVETRLGGNRSGYTESFRCAALRFADHSERGWCPPDTRISEALTDLWGNVHAHAKRRRLTFLWVHDLSKTSRTTDMLHHLPDLGWTLAAFSLNVGAPWMVWRRNRSTLKVVDLMSIWPTSLDQIGKHWGLSQRPAPDDDAPYLAWAARARSDLAILSVAVDSYVDWVRTDNLGPLAVTGNGQAWSAFRRRFMPYGILCHQETELLAMERRAMWTGRCEAFWHGALLRQVVDEWDFSRAHITLCQTEDMPTFPHGPIDPARPLADYLADDRYHVLAEVEIDTDVPCAPTLVGAHIVWPTGVFITTLWAPELRIALGACRSVRVLRGWLYRRAPALRGWADWCTSQLDATDDVVPAWRKDVIKRWGNALVGRFAMRYPQWELVGRSPVSDVFCTPCVNVQTDDEFLLMQVGFDMWQQVGTVAPNNSAPMVTGYVMSAMRAKLWQVMQDLPEKALLYVDTDSLLVTDFWRRTMQKLCRTEPFQGLRLKRSWDGMAIYGPRQLVTGDSVRVAGLPKIARRTGRHEFEGEVTESLQAAMGARAADHVRIVPRQWKVVGTDTRRTGPAIGWTAPFRVDAREVAK
jgi:hypothetical protein